MLSTLPEADADDPWLHIHLGYHYRQLRNYDLALQHWTEAARRNPSDADRQYDLALLYQINLGQHGQAIPHWLQALELGIDTPDAYLHLGNAYSKLGDRERAGTWFRRALKRYPDMPQANEIKALLRRFSIVSTTPIDDVAQPRDDDVKARR